MGQSGPNHEAPLGVFDSGLGGLTVLAAIERALPNESVLYLGDTARVPYGTKSAGTVTQYSRQTADFLVRRGVKAVVVACNTASAHALPALRRELPVPVVGVVEPGARMAAGLTKLGKIGVLGTLGTITSGAYQRALQALQPHLVVFGQACPLFVPLAEEGWEDHAVAVCVAEHYLAELRATSGDLDTLLLGCTHYPLLRRTVACAAERIFGHELHLVDSAEAVAGSVGRLLGEHRLLRQARGLRTEDFVVTDESRFPQLAARFLGRAVDRVSQIDLGQSAGT